jgi:hypothetical protein
MVALSIDFKASRVVVGLMAAYAASLISATAQPIDPFKAYSTIGISPGETLRLNVVNIGGTHGYPPDPCNVQMGFLNVAGALLKNANATIAPGHAAFVAINYDEASASLTTSDSRQRVNVRAVVNTLAPPCRTISSAELFNTNLGTDRAYAVPVESPSTQPPPDPEFGILAITPFDSLRLNVTNITGSNGVPPDPCKAQMGFVNAAGNPIKTTAGEVDPGHTAAITINYFEAAAGSPSTFSLARLDLRPMVELPPPCRVAVSAELVNFFTGQTAIYVLPAVQSNTAPPPLTNTVGQ